RAVARAQPHSGHYHLFAGAQAQRGGHERPSRRAERAPDAGNRRLCLCAREGTRGAERRGSGPLERPESEGSLSGSGLGWPAAEMGGKDMHRREFLKTGTALALAGAMPRIARAQQSKIVFGGSVPMTGVAAETGLNVLRGYECAVKFINEEMGGVDVGGQKYTLELNLFDDARDPARASTLIQRQVDEGIGFFLGSFGSNIVLPPCAITEAAGRIMVQAGGGSDLIFTQGRKRVFGIFPRASRQFVSSVDMFLDLEPKPQTVSILYTNDAFSEYQAEGARDGLEAAGFEV